MKSLQFMGRRILYYILLVGLLFGGTVAFNTFIPSNAYAHTISQTSGPQVSAHLSPSRVSTGGDTILFVHGFSPTDGFSNSAGGDCHGYWNDALDYVSKTHSGFTWGHKDFRTIGFYNGDYNCTANLHSSSMYQNCNNYYPEGSAASENGTTNESIYHLSCLFAWYVYDNWGRNNGQIEIVAHSMGGLIVRNAIYQVQKKKAPQAFPPTMATITDVVTFASPYLGIPSFSQLVCGGCRQSQDMSTGSSFTNEMVAQADNPQANGTDWTVMGSECDAIVRPDSAVGITNAGHKVIFAKTYVPGTNQIQMPCYTHTDILHYSDSGISMNTDNWDASQYYCDWQANGAAACNTDYQNFTYCSLVCVEAFHDMWFALWYDTW